MQPHRARRLRRATGPGGGGSRRGVGSALQPSAGGRQAAGAWPRPAPAARPAAAAAGDRSPAPTAHPPARPPARPLLQDPAGRLGGSLRRHRHRFKQRLAAADVGTLPAAVPTGPDAGANASASSNATGMGGVASLIEAGINKEFSADAQKIEDEAGKTFNETVQKDEVRPAVAARAPRCRPPPHGRPAPSEHATPQRRTAVLAGLGRPPAGPCRPATRTTA